MNINIDRLEAASEIAKEYMSLPEEAKSRPQIVMIYENLTQEALGLKERVTLRSSEPKVKWTRRNPLSGELVYKYIKENPGCDHHEMTKHFGVSKYCIPGHTQKLRASKRIYYKGFRNGDKPYTFFATKGA